MQSAKLVLESPADLIRFALGAESGTSFCVSRAGFSADLIQESRNEMPVADFRKNKTAKVFR